MALDIIGKKGALLHKEDIRKRRRKNNQILNTDHGLI